MTAYNCDHLNSMVTGWGVGGSTIGTITANPPTAMFAYVSGAMWTTRSGVDQQPFMPTTEAELLAWVNADPEDLSRDFYPDGDMWVSIMGIGPSNPTVGHWSVD